MLELEERTAENARRAMRLRTCRAAPLMQAQGSLFARPGLVIGPLVIWCNTDVHDRRASWVGRQHVEAEELYAVDDIL